VDVLSSMENKSEADNRIFALISLQKIASNMSVNPTAIFSKTVPTADETFEGTLKDLPETDIVLTDLGFVKKESLYHIQGEVDVRYATRVEKDLEGLIEKELENTKIYQSIAEIKEKNELGPCRRVLKLLKKSFENVVADPHATKFHRILLRKLFGSKFPAGLKLLAALELEVQTESETVVFPYPHPKGVVRLERISSVLDMSMKRFGLDQSDADLLS
jgi:hypothetical protein